MENTLIFCTNLFGHLKPELLQRLQAVIDNPTAENWEDAHGIIISKKKFTTLWQAVCKFDNTFPVRTKPVRIGETIPPSEKWERVPTSLAIKQAIKGIIFEKNLN